MNIVLFIFAVLPLIQFNRNRALLCALFCYSAILHDVLFGAADGEMYYLSAAAFDFVVVMVLHRLFDSKLSVTIQKISLLSMLLNFGGYILWYNYMEPMMYDYLFLALYAYAIFIFIGRGIINVGDDTAYSNRLSIYLSSSTNNNPSI